jgi:hypothetical protein
MDRPELKTLESAEFYKQLRLREEQYLYFLNFPTDLIHLIAQYAVTFNIVWNLPNFAIATMGNEIESAIPSTCQGIDQTNILFSSSIVHPLKGHKTIMDCLSDFTWHRRMNSISENHKMASLPDDSLLYFDAKGLFRRIEKGRELYIYCYSAHEEDRVTGRLAIHFCLF